MSAVSFFTPVQNEILHNQRYVSNPELGIYNFFKERFCFHDKIVLFQPDEFSAIIEKYKPAVSQTVLKVVSYALIAIPTLMIVGEVAVFHPPMRLNGGSSEIPEKNRLLFPNRKTQSSLDWVIKTLEDEMKSISHGYFTDSDLTRFNEANTFCANKMNNQNGFLSWLNQPEEKNLFHSVRSEELYMNCADFIYAVLHHAGLVTKDQIIANYLLQVYFDLNRSNQPYFYGFNIRNFTGIDAVKGNASIVPEFGDILLAIDDKLFSFPVHILFFSGLNPKTGEWKGIGLWRTDCTNKHIANMELSKLQNGYYRRCRRSLSFKLCPLEIALQF